MTPEKPTLSGEMRAVQERLHDKSAPRPSLRAAITDNRWTPAAVMAIIAMCIPLVQQWRDSEHERLSVIECQAQTTKLEERVKKLEAKIRRLRR